ncbi:phage tail protein [Roseateles cellulosilyticus]|uniref:Tail fiber protein n=1 Tax=Pelomonas cellulosilytica TaxID=2906762 RepID=A0ABS8XN04_9BURK|nr:tail fiber protein [Pelomonas sp. P8]MCE4554147.1 tail fiber protein [Pelomonas sp. P8]
MSDQFLGELRLMSFNYAPKGWALCNGQILPIQQNQALFSLLGTTYGGNGVTNFKLPDLRGRAPLHSSTDLPLGLSSGQEAVTLSTSQIPPHTHTLVATSELANANAPGNAVPATKGRGGVDRYATAGSATVMDPGTIAPNVGGQPHPNMQPFQVLSWAIALVGMFPSRD